MAEPTLLAHDDPKRVCHPLSGASDSKLRTTANSTAHPVAFNSTEISGDFRVVGEPPPIHDFGTLVHPICSAPILS